MGPRTEPKARLGQLERQPDGPQLPDVVAAWAQGGDGLSALPARVQLVQDVGPSPARPGVGVRRAVGEGNEAGGRSPGEGFPREIASRRLLGLSTVARAAQAGLLLPAPPKTQVLQGSRPHKAVDGCAQLGRGVEGAEVKAPLAEDDGVEEGKGQDSLAPLQPLQSLARGGEGQQRGRPEVVGSQGLGAEVREGTIRPGRGLGGLGSRSLKGRGDSGAGGRVTVPAHREVDEIIVRPQASLDLLYRVGFVEPFEPGQGPVPCPRAAPPLSPRGEGIGTGRAEVEAFGVQSRVRRRGGRGGP